MKAYTRSFLLTSFVATFAVTAGAAQTPASHPSSIVFESDRTGNREIFAMTPDGTRTTQLTHESTSDGHPTWSPDGTMVAFQSYRDGNFELWVTDAVGSQPRRVAESATSDIHPAWSPDGTELAYTCRIEDQTDICVVGVDGTGFRRLTTHPETDNYPAWSPDGKKIAWTTDRPTGGQGEIYVMDAATGANKLNLTNTPGTPEAYPDWSPDGQRLAFSSKRGLDRALQIYVMQADGGNATRLTQDRARAWEPAWSPDGSRIAFQSFRDGDWEIYTINADGSGLTNLTQDRGNDFVPDWIVHADRLDCGGTVGVRMKWNVDLPEDFMNALTQCAFEPTVVVLNNADQWIVSGGNQILRSANLPPDLEEKLEAFERDHGQLDAADLTMDGRWLITAGTHYAESGAPLEAKARVSSILGSGGNVTSFAMSPTQSDRWLLVDGEGNVAGEQIPRQIDRMVEQSSVTQLEARQVRFMPDGSWLLLGSDQWHVSEGLQEVQLRNLDWMRTDGAQVDHMLGYERPGGFLMLSNGPPERRDWDQIWLLENMLTSTLESNIWSRLEKHNITGAALAIVRNDKLAWARGYGLREAEDLESYVRPDTTFDFASVSKAIAAFSLMQLAARDEEVEGGLSLSRRGGLQDVEPLIPEEALESFRKDVQPEKGNIIQAMQHCAGFCYAKGEDCLEGGTQWAASQYPVDEPPPDTGQVLTGTDPARTDYRLLRVGDPGEKSVYSTANYMLVQALVDVHAGSFVAHTDKLFSDLGMESSTFVSPYPGRDSGNFARGHDESRAMQPRYAYGELAGASLVSTVEDIARFVIALNQDGQGVLSKRWFKPFVGRTESFLRFCDDADDMALGIYRNNKTGWVGGQQAAWGETIWHNGSHNGYRARMYAFPHLDSGIVLVLTGSKAAAADFFGELMAGFKVAYSIR